MKASNYLWRASLSVFIALLMSFCLPIGAQTGQSEPSVQYVEGMDPLWINYGEHTTDCQIQTTGDLDSIRFHADEGTIVRVLVVKSSENILFTPLLETWDPDQIKIVGQSGTWFVASDITITKTGGYSIIISNSIIYKLFERIT